MAPTKEKAKGSKSISSLAKQLREMKNKWATLVERNKLLESNNKKLVDTVNELRFDKGELTSKLECAQKKRGNYNSAEAEQVKLAEYMVSSVRNLVQQKFFPLWPFLDKQMFHKGNLVKPAIAFLGIAEADSQKYVVDIRRECLQKTAYWRGYCGDRVKEEYISKYGSKFGAWILLSDD